MFREISVAIWAYVRRYLPKEWDDIFHKLEDPQVQRVSFCLH
jgi:hypothetical protein